MGLDNLLERRTRAHQRRERLGGGGDGGEPIGRFVRAGCREGTAKAIQTGLGPGAAQHGALDGAHRLAEFLRRPAAGRERMLERGQQFGRREFLGERRAGGIVDLDVPALHLRRDAAR